MSQPRLDPDAARAVQVVSEAAALLRTVEDELTQPAFAKADASLVTIADLAVQAIVAERLARYLPDDPLVAEEDTTTLRTSPDRLSEVTALVRRLVPNAPDSHVLAWIDRGKGQPARRFWTLDPIDGTEGLLHGRQYVVALALVEDGVVRLGAVACPRLALRMAVDQRMVAAGRSKGIVVAVRGGGAWWISGDNPRADHLTVSACQDPRDARLLRSHEAEHEDAARFDRAVRALGSRPPPLPMDSQAKQVVLAAGAADLLMRFPPRPDFHDAIWDYAAGSFIIEEAGGRVTDLAGRPLDFTAGRRLLHNNGFLGSNGALHESALAAIRRAT